MCDLDDGNYYRSSGEMYLDALRKSLCENVDEQDKLNMVKAAQHFQEQMLHGISAIADVLAIVDEDSLDVNTRAGLGAVINELSVLAFDCYEEIYRYSANLVPPDNVRSNQIYNTETEPSIV